ncbi:MAG: hypothetical protein DMG40_07790 [Acidobacteria bacterium]|nr:MAG: hypothetical protein DMG40_07790 [Acidobacteriota bacterium]
MSRHGFRATVFSFCLPLMAALWATPGYAINKDFDQTYPLEPCGRFELQNINGPVDVQGWDRNEVEIHAVKTAEQQESDLERVSIEVNARADAVAVTTRYPQNEGVEVIVKYVVHVPHRVHVEHIGTVNGTLRISGLDNVEDLHTVNGDIDVFESGGNVRAHTTNGNVRVELTRAPDNAGATAETTNGSLVLAVPSDLQAEIDARCMNGNFYSELPIAMESTDRPREMHGKLGGGGAPIHLRTVNGGIRLVVLRSSV